MLLLLVNEERQCVTEMVLVFLQLYIYHMSKLIIVNADFKSVCTNKRDCVSGFGKVIKLPSLEY